VLTFLLVFNAKPLKERTPRPAAELVIILTKVTLLTAQDTQSNTDCILRGLTAQGVVIEFLAPDNPRAAVPG
jgi:hypothetical protein